MTLIKISEDGLMGKSVNPSYNRIGKYPPLDVDNENWKTFEATNPPYPLTEPCEPNSEVEAQLVWQWQSIYGGWDNLQFGETIEDYAQHNFNTRQAWQVSKPKAEIPAGIDFNKQYTIISMANNMFKQPDEVAEVTEQSIEEAAQSYAEGNKNKQHGDYYPRTEAFKAGYKFALTSKGMVELDKVSMILNKSIHHLESKLNTEDKISKTIAIHSIGLLKIMLDEIEKI